MPPFETWADIGGVVLVAMFALWMLRKEMAERVKDAERYTKAVEQSQTQTNQQRERMTKALDDNSRELAGVGESITALRTQVETLVKVFTDYPPRQE